MTRRGDGLLRVAPPKLSEKGSQGDDFRPQVEESLATSPSCQCMGEIKSEAALPGHIATPPASKSRSDYTPKEHSEPTPYGRVARVSVTKCTATPPNKVKRITGVLDQRKGEDHPPLEYVEPAPYGRVPLTYICDETQRDSPE